LKFQVFALFFAIVQEIVNLVVNMQKKIKNGITCSFKHWHCLITENNSANQQLPLSSITNKMPFTPQAADPSKLLRKNLRLKVETQVKIINEY
jgi:hypothetical protein